MPVLIAILIIGCQSGVAKRETSTMRFFDLQGLVQDFVNDSLSVDVEKTVILDGGTESKKLDDYALYEDVKPFENYDINKPALFDKYLADTINDTSQILRYTAKEEGLSVQTLQITKNLQDESVESVEITNRTHSFLEEVEMKIVWKLNDGYSLRRQSRKKVGKDSVHEIFVRRI